MENKANSFEKKTNRPVPVEKLTSEQCVLSDRMSETTSICKARKFDCGCTKRLK